MRNLYIDFRFLGNDKLEVTMKGEDFLKGLVTGAVIGGILGILFAPKSGEETRKDIKEYTVKMKDKAVDAKKEAVRKFQNVRKGFKS